MGEMSTIVDKNMLSFVFDGFNSTELYDPPALSVSLEIFGCSVGLRPKNLISSLHRKI